jgi:heterodisulfide reductase subunit A
MSHVLVVGGGISGCTVAKELSDNDINVTIIEMSDKIGGKVRGYGCKATDKCNNCGVCLTSGLWDHVERNNNVNIITNSKLIDLTGEKGNFTAAIKSQEGVRYITGISYVVVSTGFAETTPANFNGFVEMDGDKGIITGSQIEGIIKERSNDSLFDKAPSSVAFIQCYGSRDHRENAMYCSKVCCNYSTKAAKVIKQYYPDCKVTFFYMELQMVQNGDYFKSLKDLGIEFIKCRPIKVSSGEPASVTYDNPETGRKETKNFDLIVLSNGIHPVSDSDRIAEIFGFSQDESGFLKYVKDSREARDTGIFVSGCAKGPEKIDEAYSESVAVAREILFA